MGQISLAMEYASNGSVGTPSMPFAECGSMSEGYIGYHIEQSIMNELNKRDIDKSIVTLITEVLVDKMMDVLKILLNLLECFTLKKKPV